MRQQLRPPFGWPQLRCACVLATVAMYVCVFKNYVCRQAKVYRFLAICRTYTHTQTVSFFFSHVAIRNSLRSNKRVNTWYIFVPAFLFLRSITEYQVRTYYNYIRCVPCRIVYPVAAHVPHRIVDLDWAATFAVLLVHCCCHCCWWCSARAAGAAMSPGNYVRRLVRSGSIWWSMSVLIININKKTNARSSESDCRETNMVEMCTYLVRTYAHARMDHKISEIWRVEEVHIQDDLRRCVLLLSHIIVKWKKRQLWGRGFRRNSSFFSSCVGYFDRAYDGFYVTSSRMLVLIQGDKIWQLWNSVNL